MAEGSSDLTDQTQNAYLHKTRNDTRNNANGTVQEIDKRTSLSAYPTDAYKVSDHLAALIERYTACANATRTNIDDTDKAGDLDTADLFTEVSRGPDKQLWFLEAFAQEPSGDFRA